MSKENALVTVSFRTMMNRTR